MNRKASQDSKPNLDGDEKPSSILKKTPRKYEKPSKKNAKGSALPSTF